MRQEARTTFWEDRQGHAAIEYALIASIVAITALGGIQALGGSSGVLYAGLAKLADAMFGS